MNEYTQEQLDASSEYVKNMAFPDDEESLEKLRQENIEDRNKAAFKTAGNR